jgi:hypothetical protein
MDDHPGCIDDPTKPGLDLPVDLFLKEGKKVFHRKGFIIQTGEVILIQDFCSESLKPFSDGLNNNSSGMDF